MLGVDVTGATLVYAEKVKFISFTFPALHTARTGAEAAPMGGV
jgi:hypothetical protein